MQSMTNFAKNIEEENSDVNYTIKSTDRFFSGICFRKSPILHIHTNEDYEEALEVFEYMFDLAEDSENDPLNDLITIISRSIEEYESNQQELVKFEQEAQAMAPSISMLRTLMNQLPNGGCSPKRFIPSFLASAAKQA
jgi:predicted house-cleaning noncanonical NTP pyrophosphatase (MazG superfamily)